MTLYWDSPREATEPVTVTGCVVADWHDYVPGDFPRTRGTIRSLAIESRRYRLAGGVEGPEWIAFGEPSYKPVAKSPRWFQRTGNETLPREAETGILSRLEVDVTPFRYGVQRLDGCGK